MDSDNAETTAERKMRTGLREGLMDGHAMRRRRPRRSKDETKEVSEKAEWRIGAL
jgi:hypothetical protein